MDEIDKIIWIEGLKNAIHFKGKANNKAVIGKLMRDRPDLRSQGKIIKPKVQVIVEQINQLTIEEQTKKVLQLDSHALDPEEKAQKEEKILPDLPNAEKGKVIMRLAPYPSGALHIGNARMVVLNDEYVKRYQGKLLLVFDDTIGTTLAQMDDPKAKYVIPEAYDLIPEGLEWLGVKYHEVYYKSDRVQIYQEEAEKLIAQGHAYVCTCDPKTFREEYKRPGKDCPCRGKSIEYHMDMYEKMKDGTIAEQGAVVRLKTGMNQKDPALRDHILMRISDAPHPRIGSKVRLWPVLEWSWGLDDHLLGVTHIVRGIDLRKEGEIEKFIWDLYGWPHAEIQLYGRLKFSGEFKLSKTLARQNVYSGEYEGWSDPRTWSLQSLAARGIQPSAVREALLDLGMSNRGIEFDKKWVYAKNTKLIDEHANRYWFVENPHSVLIEKIPFDKFTAEPLLHPNFPERGTRKIELPIKEGKARVYIAESDLHEYRNKRGKLLYPKLDAGQILRFKDMFNVEVKEMNDPIKVYFHSQEMSHNSRKVQVVPADESIFTKVLQPDGIITTGYATKYLKDLKVGDIVQFERYGYVKLKQISKDEIYGYFTNN
ncbi:MAG: glutamate--tRNA ligase [Candidatus Lokiarchaeota archaeon]|nr:glutamate--tRNA ligase [Candidatus Harpocratesius repetitus]